MYLIASFIWSLEWNSEVFHICVITLFSYWSESNCIAKITTIQQAKILTSTKSVTDTVLQHFADRPCIINQESTDTRCKFHLWNISNKQNEGVLWSPYSLFTHMHSCHCVFRSSQLVISHAIHDTYLWKHHFPLSCVLSTCYCSIKEMNKNF